MKLTVFVYVSFIIMLILAVIALFFQNKFLFFLHGYDSSLIGDTKVESFIAYKNIYKSRLLLYVIGFLSSLVALFFSNKSNSKLIFTISLLLGLLFLAMIFFYFFLPKKIIQYNQHLNSVREQSPALSLLTWVVFMLQN